MDVERGAENLKKAKSWQEKARKKKVDNFHTSQFYAILGDDLTESFFTKQFQVILGILAVVLVLILLLGTLHSYTHSIYNGQTHGKLLFLSTFNYKVKICIFSNYYFL